MKKAASLLLALVMLLSLTACGSRVIGGAVSSTELFVFRGRGDVGEVGVLEVDSDRYTAAEIDDGVDAVLDYFKKHFSGCTLREVQYIGDEENSDYLDFATRNGADEVMVFSSAFDVDGSGGDGSLNPNSTYKNWKWILVRTNGGAWEHVDHGY